MNVKISNINAKINILKEEYTNLQNEVNYNFWPIDAKISKRKKDFLWLFSIAICLLITVILAVLFDILRNEYLTGLVLGLSIIILGFTGFMTFLYFKKHKELAKVWQKELIPVEKLKVELDEMMKEATEMMVKYLIINYKLTEEKIVFEAGTSYDEVYVYYDRVINE